MIEIWNFHDNQMKFFTVSRPFQNDIFSPESRQNDIFSPESRTVTRVIKLDRRAN